MTADQLITMKDEAILLTGNMRPFRFRIKPYFKQRKFRQYANMKPAELPFLGKSTKEAVSEPDTEIQEVNPDEKFNGSIVQEIAVEDS